MQKIGKKGRKASLLAYIALFSMFAGIGFGFLGSFWAFLFLFLASPVLALIVLIVEHNTQSRKLAWVTLGVWAALVITGGILLARIGFA